MRNHQNIIVYVPVVISVKVDLHNRPFKIPSILKRKRKTPTDSELLAFLNDNIWDNDYKDTDFFTY